MGSGWAPAVDALGDPAAEFPVTELPGFPPPAVEGHGGKVRSYQIGDKRALVFLGRTHFYEGRGVAAVAHGVRTAVAAGCKTIVLTNGCGGLREGMRPGQPVLISDHINLTATSPIVGANFVDLTDLYSPRLRALCKEIDATPRRGRVRAVPRAALRDARPRSGWSRAIGADLVGMSTTLEAIAAREAGAEVLGHLPRDQPRRRYDRRAAQPRGGPPGGPRLRHPHGYPADPGPGPAVSSRPRRPCPSRPSGAPPPNPRSSTPHGPGTRGRAGLPARSRPSSPSGV